MFALFGIAALLTAQEAFAAVAINCDTLNGQAAPKPSPDQRAAAKPDGEALEPISLRQLYEHVWCGHTVARRLISGPDVVMVLQRLGGTSPLPENAGLRVEDSVVERGVYFRDLPATSIDSLADDQKKYFASARKDKVGVVAIPIRFKKTLFRDDRPPDSTTLRASLLAENVVFLQGLHVDDCVLDHDVYLNQAIIAGAIPASGGQFSNTVFRGEVLLREVWFAGSAAFQRSSFGRFTAFNRVRFSSSVWFDEARFHDYADFSTVDFGGSANFSKVIFASTVTVWQESRFGGDALFQDAHFLGRAALFGGVHFAKAAYFNRAVFTAQWTFNGANFDADAVFVGIGQTRRLPEAGEPDDSAWAEDLAQLRAAAEKRYDPARTRLLILASRFKALADFRSAKIPFLYVSQPAPRGRPEEKPVDPKTAGANIADGKPGGKAGEVAKSGDVTLNSMIRPTIFDGEAVFGFLKCEVCSFARTRFLGPADFYGAEFQRSADFNRVAFSQDVSFAGASFPRLTSGKDEQVPKATDLDRRDRDDYRGLVIEQLKSQRPPRWEWRQLEDSINSQSKETYQALEDWFTTAKDARAASQAAYRRERLAAKEADGMLKVAGFFDHVTWGHGHRPSFALAWIAALLVLFSAIYRTQTKSWKPAIQFAVDTSWRMGYGIKNSRGKFRAVTVLNWISIKALAVVFVLALSKQSPLLNEIVKKLLPL